jgi:hypothetical protein
MSRMRQMTIPEYPSPSTITLAAKSREMGQETLPRPQGYM